MNSLKTGSFLLLLFLVGFSACKKDEIFEEIIITDPSPVVLVNGSLQGLIMNSSGDPIADAVVRVGIYDVLSDENGVFTFNNIPLEEEGALITAQKDGYFYNAKFVRPRLNKRAYTKFKMIEKTLSGAFAASTGGTILANGNAKVSIAANGVKTADGEMYTGNVNVYATWLDPTGDNLLMEMPGDLRGANLAGEQVQLTSFGMIGVELEDDNGAALNIADGQTATIELPVPAALQGAAPASIPLWHFDEITGIWEEEGEAILQNGVYVGTVSHFSFWNCDIPNDFITLTGSVTNEVVGIPDLLIQIVNDSDGSSGFAYTDEDGVFSGFVPRDVVLTISILNPCGEVIYTAQIGPFSEDTTIDPIAINTVSLQTLTITGVLQDCDFNGISNGYAKVEFAGGYAILLSNAAGEFNGVISTCAATELTLTGFDFDNAKQSIAQTFDLTGLDFLDVGAITVCEDITEYLISNLDTTTFIFPTFDRTLFSAGKLVIFGTTNDPVNGFNICQIQVKNMAAVTLNTPFIPEVYIGSNDEFNSSCSINSGCENLLITFQSLDYLIPGGIIQATYEGEIVDNFTTEVINVSGSFRVIVE